MSGAYTATSIQASKEEMKPKRENVQDLTLKNLRALKREIKNLWEAYSLLDFHMECAFQEINKLKTKQTRKRGK